MSCKQVQAPGVKEPLRCLWRPIHLQPHSLPPSRPSVPAPTHIHTNTQTLSFPHLPPPLTPYTSMRLRLNTSYSSTPKLCGCV